MSLSLVVAVSSNNIIGHNGDLPWGRSLKADLRRFKAITMGHPILMGRKTWDSLGRALPGLQIYRLGKSYRTNTFKECVERDGNRRA